MSVVVGIAAEAAAAGDWDASSWTAPAHAPSGSVDAGDTPTCCTSPAAPTNKTRVAIKRKKKCGIGADSRPHVEGRARPLEESLRSYAGRGSGGPVLLPRVGMEFDSCEEAFDFYNLYSWEIGFGIRYSSNQTYRKNGQIYRNMQMIVCTCAGSPDPGAKKSVKQGCPALIRLLRTNDDGWYIKEFCGAHNHTLSDSCGEKSWKSHKQIDPHTKDLIKNLKENNVGMPRVDSMLASIFGSNTVAAGTKRALQSLSAQISREKEKSAQASSIDSCVQQHVQINNKERPAQSSRESSVSVLQTSNNSSYKSEDDVQRTVEVFNKLHEEDAGFANVIELDCYGKVKTMMWTNGKSRSDYRCFGDAVTFDTTYRTNKYNMPFGLFVGANNHFQPVVFAGVLMRDETVESFEWVFAQFVALMGGEAPQTILTDQCHAMEAALANKLPQVTHRWCKWHVFRAIKRELGPKYTKEFKKGLNKVCNHALSPREFEAGWADLMKKHGLEADAYMSGIYENRKMWAKAYFMGKFCGKQTSTQWSESASRVLKGYLPPGAPMHVFVEQYHKLLCDWNEKEDAMVREDRMQALKEPSATVWPIESHAVAFYTRTMLQKFVEQIRLGVSYDVFEIIPRRKYRLDHVKNDLLRRDEWSRVSYEVDVLEDGEFYRCECGLWEHTGMLCCHSIRVMMQLMVGRIPEKHLMIRWSRDARKAQQPPSYAGQGQGHEGSLHCSRTFRNTSLGNKARELVNLGDLNMECYDYCYQALCAAIEELKSKMPVPDADDVLGDAAPPPQFEVTSE